MRFSLEKTELLTALNRVLISEAAKNSLTGGLIRISIANRRLELAAAESAVCATTTLPIDVSGEAGLCVQNRRLQEALKVMPSAKIQVMITTQTLRLEAEGFRLDIGGVGLDHFAILPASPSGGQKVPSGVLHKILKRTAYAVMADMTHPVMAGVYLSFTDGWISAEATDGKRLARAVEKASAGGTLRMLVNYKAVAKLLEVLDESSDVTLTERGRHLFFVFPQTTVIAPKMDGNFPGLSSAIPAAVSHRVRIGRQALIDALDAAIVVESWYSSDEQIVKCEVRPTHLIISARSGEQGTARARVPAKTEGDPYSVFLNGIHLRQSVRELDTPEIELSFAANDMRGVIVRALGEASESLAVLVRSRLEE